MSVHSFLPFRSVGRDNLQALEGNRCMAYLDNWERCDNLISEDHLEAIGEVHNKYGRNDETMDDSTLSELAKLCLCSEAGHNANEHVKSAVQQWKQTGLSTATSDAVSSTPPAPEKTKKSKQPAEFEFTDAASVSKALPELIDLNIKTLLASAPTNDPAHLFLMGHEAAKGTYKLYRRKDRDAATPDKKCYENAKVICWVECSDTKLVNNLVLKEFAAQCRDHLCGTRGHKSHQNWIKAPSAEIEASLRAWSDLLKVDYLSLKLPEAKFSEESNRWTKWAQEMVESFKVKTPPPLPPRRPVPVTQEPSDSSISSASTTFTEGRPPPSTPSTSTEIQELPSSPPPRPVTDPGMQSENHHRVGFRGKTKRAINRLRQSVENNMDPDAKTDSRVFDVVVGVGRTLRNSMT
ncbi:hypothetical protein BDV12DRAFT_147082 [Aspergillus spectabilis]